MSESKPEKKEKKDSDKEKKGILHTCMIKKVVDDSDGGLALVGTFVQRVFDLTEEEVNNGLKFEYRFNESNPKVDEELHHRRTDPLDKSGKIVGTKSTFEFRIPLEIDSLYSAFPFQINVASATVELSSKEYRPDLYLSDNRRHNINIQNLTEESNLVGKAVGLDSMDRSGIMTSIFEAMGRHEECKNRKMMSKILDKIDQTKQYNFLTPHPIVSYQYDTKKDYCPRFKLSFFAVTDGFEKWVQIMMPILLVTVIQVFNFVADAFCEDEDEPISKEKCGPTIAEHLGISSALTLTVVFILPQTLEYSNRKGSTSQDVFVVVYFISLILSSVPKKLVQTAVPQWIGIVTMCVTVLSFPCWNLLRFHFLKQKIRAEAKAQHASVNHRFLSDETDEFWNVKNGKEGLYFVKECTGKNFGKKDIYDVEESGRYKQVYWANPKSKTKGEIAFDKAKEKASKNGEDKDIAV